jgi:hypothetical protein
MSMSIGLKRVKGSLTTVGAVGPLVGVLVGTVVGVWDGASVGTSVGLLVGMVGICQTSTERVVTVTPPSNPSGVQYYNIHSTGLRDRLKGRATEGLCLCAPG